MISLFNLFQDLDIFILAIGTFHVSVKLNEYSKARNAQVLETLA